jgi:hypothetical protein
MIPVYEPVYLWLACILTGGSVAMLYSLATMWRLGERRRSSREPFSGVNINALSEPVRQLVSDALASRTRKPTSLWLPLARVVLSVALSYRLYQVAFGVGHHVAIPVMIMVLPSLMLTMGIGFCLIPLVSIGFVHIACWKAKRSIQQRRKALIS